MKTNVYRLLLLSIVMTMAMFVQAQVEYGVVFEENFENGTPADSGWTQEYSGVEHDWVVESGDGLTRPIGAYDGDKRVALRNGTTTSKGYVTMLVSPVMDLSKLFNPILKFAYAQDQWTNDFDTLRVYYRSDATKPWTPIKEYDSCASEWKYETMNLTGQSPTYQIAFEGTDNMGRGIVLDDIMVRSTPNCLQPYNVRATEVSNDSVVLRWNGNVDSEKFLIKVHTDSIPEGKLDSTMGNVFDGHVPTMTFFQSITGLIPGTIYYAYVKSVCSDEVSPWSKQLIFKTTNIEKVPYIENFNRDITGVVTRLDNWVYGASEGAKPPFINTNTSVSSVYYFSPDTTTALMITGGDTWNSMLTPGEYTYCATPEMDVDSVSKLQVSFWGRYWYDWVDQNKLIIGVMTDAHDITTFEPIDTVEYAKYKIFEEFIIPLSSYEGKGKHIALLARFKDGTNQFYLDDFKVEYIPSCVKARDIKVSQKSATEATISWFSGDATTGDIVLSETLVAAKDLENKITHAAVSNGSNITNLKPWTKYYIYVRNLCGSEKGEWSNMTSFLTPNSIEILPDTIDFEIDAKNPSTYYLPMEGNNNKLSKDIITLYNGNAPPKVDDYGDNKKSTWDLYVAAEKEGDYAYVVFPELADIKNTKVEFWARKKHNLRSGVFEVGVMEDINDVSTFTHIDSIETTVENKYYRVNLDQYSGNGKFFAIRVLYDAMGAKATQVCFDNLLFAKIPICKDPLNIKIAQKDISADISWDANGSEKWEVRLSFEELSEDTLNSATFTDYQFIETVTKESITIPNLSPNETKYYYYIKPICDDASSWTVANYFLTDCYYTNKLPYSMDFEGYSTARQAEFAVPCLFTEMTKVDTYYYPCLTSSNAYEGEACLILDGNTSDKFYNYVALPVIDEDINKLQLTMMIRANKDYGRISELHVGVMTDPNLQSSFESLFVVDDSKNNVYEEVIFSFSKYEGTGKHIAFRMAPNKKGSICVDNIVVDHKSPCAKVSKPKAVSVTDASAVVTWKKGDDETQWNLVVSTSATLTKEQCNGALKETYSDNIVFANTVNTDTSTVNGLNADTKYYFYVQARCSAEQVGQWSATVGELRTNCITLDAGSIGVEDFDTYGEGNGKHPHCWIVGNKGGNQYHTPYCDYAYKHSGKYSLRISSNTYNNGSYAISSKIDVDSMNMLQVSFWGSCSRYAGSRYKKQLVVGVITSPSDLTSFVPIDTITGYADAQYYTVQFKDYTWDYNEDKGKYVMFYSEFDMDNYFWIDDVRFDTIPECQWPEGIAIDTLTHDSIAISWAKGSVDSYNIKISTRQLSAEELNAAADPEDGAVLTTVNASDAKAHYKGLSPNSKYYLYLASNCGVKKSWAPLIRFTTECMSSYSLPFKEDFNSYTQTGVGANPDCWTSYYTAEGKENDYPYIYSGGTTGKGLYVCAYPGDKQSYAVTPLLDVDDISKCQVSFYAKPNHYNNKRNIIIGIVSDVSTNDTIVSTFFPIDTIVEKSDSYSKYTIPFTEYSGKGKYVAFTTAYSLNPGSTYGGGMYIDDIEIEMIPSCYKPDVMKIKDISSDYLRFSIEGGDDASSWDVEYGASGFELGAGTSTTTSSRDFKLQALSPKTKYDVYVRTACEIDDKSAWFGPTTATTIGIPVSVYPYNNGFEVAEENSKWTLLNGEEVNAWNIGDAHKKDGNSALYISKDNGDSAKYDIMETSHSWAVRPVKLEKGEYKFDLDWTCYGSYYDYMRIGLLPSTAKFSPGSDKILSDDGTNISLTDEFAPLQWLSLEGVYQNGNKRTILNMVDTTKSLEEQWVHNSTSYIIQEAAVYNLVIYWVNYGGMGKRPNPSAVVDNINITYSGCVEAIMLQTDNTLENEAKISWTNVGPDASKWDVFVTTNEELKSPDAAATGDEVFRGTANATNIDIKGLNAKTKYFVFVRSICGDDNYSSWSDVHEFITECSIYEIGATFGFEKNEGHYTPLSNDYKIPVCFEIGSINGLAETSGYFPYLAKSEPSSIYSRRGDYSLRMRSSTTIKGSYITFPEVNEDIDSLQVSFWMRPVYHSLSSGGMIVTSTAASGYAKTLTIGTMESPTDTASFAKVLDVLYPYDDVDLDNKRASDDPAGHSYWRKYTVAITVEAGRHIVFMSNPTDNKANVMYIDDVVISKKTSCATPYDLVAKDITDESAKIVFTHENGASWDIILSNEEDFSDTISRDTISASNYTYNNLEGNSSYFVKVQQLCEEDITSDWSMTLKIQTVASLKFTEDFNHPIQVPENWTRAIAEASEIFDGTAGFQYLGDTENSGWSHSSASLFTSGHQRLGISNLAYSWIFTPVLNVGAGTNAHLTFNLALTDARSANPPTPSDLINGAGGPHLDNMFMVIISEDGGLTWKEENATIWDNNLQGNNSFNDISYTGECIDIDLSKYMNKRIKVAFYGQSLEKNASVDLHVDNVNINYVSKQDLDQDQNCETENYNENGFNILSSELKVGENKFTRSQLASSDVADTIYNLTLNVKPMVRYPIEAILCEGEIYSDFGFSTSELGLHKHKLPAINGCDSVVTLNLSLIPPIITDTMVSICHGSSYEFNNKFYDEEGVYTDTLKSTVTDCDSIVRFALTVNDAITSEDYQVVCFGKSYNFSDKYPEITTSGVYTETFKTAADCDSIVTLTVKAYTEKADTVLNELICAGELYSENGFKGIAETGTYYIKDQKTDDGCDSLVTLNLTVLSGDTSKVAQAISTKDLPYEYHGKIYPEGTLPGVYTDTISVSADGCDDVVILTLTIKINVSVDRIDYTPFSITPNPVMVGETINVDIADNLNIVSCEVYNATGAIINSFSPNSNPIVLNINTRGVYMIRVTTDTGEVFVGKVLVK